MTCMRNPVDTTRGFCPTFFRACCHQASSGGRNSYKSAAYQLARSIPSLCPDELEDEEWYQRIDDLNDCIDDNDSDDWIVSWFLANAPDCMRHVPRRRYNSFCDGVRLAREEGRIEY